MKTDSPTKKQCQILHSKKRIQERYNIVLSSLEYSNIINLIRNNQSETLYWQSNRISIKKVDYKEQKLFCVYDSVRHTIVTFLSEEMIDKNKIEEYKAKIKEKIALEKNKKNPEDKNIKDWDEFKKVVKKLD